MIALALTVVLATAVLVGLLMWRARSVDALLRGRLRHIVVVEVRTGETFRGLLAECDERTILLRNTESVGAADQASILVDGELMLPRDDVKWIQRP